MTPRTRHHFVEYHLQRCQVYANGISSYILHTAKCPHHIIHRTSPCIPHFSGEWHHFFHSGGFTWRIQTCMGWKWPVILVIKTDLSGFVVTMSSGFCDQHVQSLGLTASELDLLFRTFSCAMFQQTYSTVHASVASSISYWLMICILQVNVAITIKRIKSKCINIFVTLRGNYSARMWALGVFIQL